MEDKKKNTEELVAKVRGVLRGRELDANEAFALSRELSGRDAHYWARRLLLKILSRPNLTQEQRRQLSQGLALATYKDPTLLRSQAFDKALEVLAGAFKLPETRDQETLGLVGSIYKRRWHLDGRRDWMERALHYYRRGFDCGVAGDQGYTAINAAFVQDVLAYLEEEALQEAAGSSQGAEERRADARGIRETILAELGAGILALRGAEEGDYWPIVTLAEVYFGLGLFEEAGEQLRRAVGIPGVADWMRKTTVEQLVNLTQVQLGTRDPEKVSQSPQWRALNQLVAEDRAPAVQTMFAGKVGLALSGGGFRASLYHLGVLAKLAELDLLRHVEVLSCVSGGAILGAQYYLELRRLLQFSSGKDKKEKGRRDEEIDQEDYIELVGKLIDDFLDGVQKNLRVRMLAHPLVNIQMLFRPTYSRTQRLGELYEKHLYSRVQDTTTETAKCAGEGRWFRDLTIRLPDEAADFAPSDVNWRRRNKVPQLVLNATTLNTGHVWQFTASWMGESPNIIDRDVDNTLRLRRMYYDEAPKPYRCFRLGHAVAASSCVPGLFEPIELPSLYEDTNVRLVDGGVYDNLGVASLAEQGCSVMIVSDASGQLSADDDPAGGILGPLMRSTSVMMGRLRGAEYEDRQAQRRSGLLKGLAYVHLTQGLEARDLSWKGCALPGEGKTSGSGDPNTYYGIRRDVQERLACIRTDLDSFSDLEAFALMNSGYHAMAEAARKITGFPTKSDREVAWQFRDLDKPMQSKETSDKGVSARKLERHLRASPLKFFKVWMLSPWLLGGTVLAGLALAYWIGAWLVEAWQSNPDMSLLATAPGQAIVRWLEEALTLRNLAWAVGTLIGGYVALALLGKYLGKKLKQFFKLRSIAQRLVIGVGIGLIGWLVAGLHLWFFDRLFLRLGRLRPRSK